MNWVLVQTSLSGMIVGYASAGTNWWVFGLWLFVHAVFLVLAHCLHEEALGRARDAEHVAHVETQHAMAMSAGARELMSGPSK